MSLEPTDADLEAALRQKTSALPDDGFSLSVMQAIAADAEREQLRAFRQKIFTVVIAALVSAFALWHFRDSFVWIDSAHMQTGLKRMSEWFENSSDTNGYTTLAVLFFVAALIYFFDSRDASLE